MKFYSVRWQQYFISLNYMYTQESMQAERRAYLWGGNKRTGIQEASMSLVPACHSLMLCQIRWQHTEFCYCLHFGCWYSLKTVFKAQVVAWCPLVDGQYRIFHKSKSVFFLHGFQWDQLEEWSICISWILILVTYFYLGDTIPHSSSRPHLLCPEITQSTFALWRLSYYFTVSHLALCFIFARLLQQNIKLMQGQ